MIVRRWHGWAPPGSAPAYAQHVSERVFPGMAAIDGFRGGLIARRDDPNEVEFIVETIWESRDAIRRFAGDSIDNAVVEPAARKLLSRYDDRVRHYELLDSVGDCKCCEVKR